MLTVLPIRVADALGAGSIAFAAVLYAIDVFVLFMIVQKRRLFWLYAVGIAIVAATLLAGMIVGMRLPYMMLESTLG